MFVFSLYNTWNKEKIKNNKENKPHSASTAIPTWAAPCLIVVLVVTMMIIQQKWPNQLFILLVVGIRSSSCFSLNTSTLVWLRAPPQSGKQNRTSSVIWGWLTNLLWIRILFGHTPSHPTLSFSIILSCFFFFWSCSMFHDSVKMLTL